MQKPKTPFCWMCVHPRNTERAIFPEAKMYRFRPLAKWHLEDVAKLPRDGSVTLLDTRTVGEYNRGHMEGFKNIPVDELRERIGEIEVGKPVYAICQSGLRSYIATRILEGYGFEAYNFAGGFRFYDAVMNDRALIEQASLCGMDK